MSEVEEMRLENERLSAEVADWKKSYETGQRQLASVYRERDEAERGWRREREARLAAQDPSRSEAAERIRLADAVRERRRLLHEQNVATDITREDAIYEICIGIIEGAEA